MEALVSGVLVLALVTRFTAQFLGLSTFSDADNRGLGTPLSVQELRQLQQDEPIQRTTMEGGSDTSEGSRPWQDLSPEELREELALIKIIQGQDVRIK